MLWIHLGHMWGMQKLSNPQKQLLYETLYLDLSYKLTEHHINKNVVSKKTSTSAVCNWHWRRTSKKVVLTFLSPQSHQNVFKHMNVSYLPKPNGIISRQPNKSHPISLRRKTQTPGSERHLQQNQDQGGHPSAWTTSICKNLHQIWLHFIQNILRLIENVNLI